MEADFQHYYNLDLARILWVEAEAISLRRLRTLIFHLPAEAVTRALNQDGTDQKPERSGPTMSPETLMATRPELFVVGGSDA